MNEYDNLKASQVPADARQAYYGDTCSNQAMPTACRVPLREQLEKTQYAAAEQASRVARALEILQRNPEFEEFLQLQDLINTGLFRY